MLPQVPKIPSALFLGLALALFQPARAQTAIQTYHISPDSVASGKDFTLTLLGGFGCGTVFSRESVTVEGAAIHLSFEADQMMLAQEKASIVCPVMDTSVNYVAPYYGGPTFKMAALKAGKYQVWATQVYSCMFTSPRCLMATREEFAGTLTVGADGSIGYQIDPTLVKAKTAFDLQLLSYQFNCGTTFDHLASSVSGNEIVLTFMDHQNLVVDCPAVYKPYGPSYKMAGLAAGTYKVMAARLPACVDQGCKILQTLVPAGTLTVSADTGRVDKWFISPKQVPAGKAFSLHLLNDIYGNCNTAFPNASLVVDKNNILTSFSIQTDLKRECFADIHPAGPIFDVPALKSGMYPVYALIRPYCPSGALCPMYMPIQKLVDTLVVANALGIDPFLASTSGFRASFQASGLAVTLPEGASGSWKVELVTLSGKHVGAARIEAEGGSAVRLDLQARPERGIYLVRIESPDHVIRALPLSRAE